MYHANITMTQKGLSERISVIELNAISKINTRDMYLMYNNWVCFWYQYWHYSYFHVDDNIHGLTKLIRNNKYME